MTNTTDRILFSDASTAGSVMAQHREFPEIRSEGETPEGAASLLRDLLTRTLDSALTDWRRQSIEKSIADVDDFLAHVNA